MTQSEAIKRLHLFASENTVGCTEKDEQTQEWETYQKSLKGWAAEKYFDQLVGNVRAVAEKTMFVEGISWRTMVADAVDLTHATIAALEVGDAS